MFKELARLISECKTPNGKPLERIVLSEENFRALLMEVDSWSALPWEVSWQLTIMGVPVVIDG